MRGSRNGFLIILCGGMLLSWIYAWTSFTMPILNRPPFPLPDGALILTLAIIITRLHLGRGWRVFAKIGIHAVGFIWAVFRMVYLYLDAFHAFGSGQWIAILLAQQGTFLEWLLLILVLLWTLVLWIGGVWIARKSFERYTIPSLFDLGAAAFLLLLLIQLLMLSRGVSLNPDNNAAFCFVAFFVFGLLGMGLARYGDVVERGYIATYRGIGVVLSFMVFALLFGGGLVLLLLPSLRNAAELGHGLLKTVSKPIIPFIETVLLLFLAKGCQMEPRNFGPPESPEVGYVPRGDEWGLSGKILTWLFTSYLGLLSLIVFGFVVFYLIRWLASRRPQAQERLGIWDLFLHLISIAKTHLVSFFAWMIRKGSVYGRAGRLYARLLRWGSRCGLPHVPCETPLEYGSRLARQFPGLNHEIALIIDLFNQDVYGNLDPDPNQLANARLAWRRLRSPRIWPARLKAWFYSPEA